MKTESFAIRKAVLTVIKIIASGFIFFIGIMLGGVIASLSGMTAPAIPPGTDESTLSLYMLAGSFLVAAILALISPRLRIGILPSGLILGFFIWITMGINTILEASVFSPEYVDFGYFAVMYGVAGLLFGLATAWLFPPEDKSSLSFRLSSPPVMGWPWRLLAAIAAFPVIYVLFGMLIEPFVSDYYIREVAGLRLPGWGELIPVLLLRSTMFLLACLPIVLLWNGFLRVLTLSTGLALFLFTGGIPMLQGYWLPTILRVVHALEILASSLAYIGVLVLIFRAGNIRLPYQAEQVPRDAIRLWWVKNLVYVILAGLILFLASGETEWVLAWVYLCCTAGIIVANAVSMDPALIADRSRLQEGTVKRDVLLATGVALYGPMLVLLISGLDLRFGWSPELPSVLTVSALILFVASGLLATRAMAVNTFFSGTLRIQTDRNQKVITEGPYRFVRHPGYLGGILSILLTPVALGSLIALIPALIVVILFLIRTRLEDNTLQAELYGYKEYTRIVRYRLLPGIW